MVLNHSGGIARWHSWRIAYPDVEGLIAASFIAAYLITRPLQGWGIAKLMQAIGAISFSMYILHYAIQGEFWGIAYPQFFKGTITGLNGVFIATTVIAVLIAALSALSYACIEKPFQDMRGKYLKPRAVPTDQSSLPRRSTQPYVERERVAVVASMKQNT
jgi:peptidoglycan/LPS O-acetylase OafA/YrhL